ncbi:hypothetical protein Tco_1016140 [Tanacetum coccineum]|uniref:Uncharacterized protein n=1 Tax=Tanacetum coccineum TaxID=301880 RepID=A0ABQ5FMZ2_9ASTR
MTAKNISRSKDRGLSKHRRVKVIVFVVESASASSVAREKKKVVEETTFHESNKLDLGLGSRAYGEDANYHEFMDDSVMEEIYIASLVMLVAEDLGQKRIHDSSETAMVLGSQGKSNEIGYFNGPIVQNISDNREKSEKIVTNEHIRGMKMVEFLEDKTDCKQPGLPNSIKWAMIGCRHQSQVAGWGLKAYQILKYPKPFIEGFRLSLQCLLLRRTWDPGITWLKILKEHLEDKCTSDAGVSFFGCSDDDTEAIVVLRKACFVYESFGKMMKLDSFRVLDFEKCRV